MIGGWHLSWMLSDHPNYPTPRGISSQPKPPSRCQSVGGTYCDRWVAPIVDAIRPPKLPNAPGKQQPTQTSKSMSIGGWHLLWMIGGWHLLWMLFDHPNYPKPRGSSSQPTPPSRCQSVGGTFRNSFLAYPSYPKHQCDRWVAPIVDAIRPPKLPKAPGNQ